VPGLSRPARRRRSPRRKPLPRVVQRGLRLGLPGLAGLAVLGAVAWAWSSGWMAARAADAGRAVLGLTAEAGFGIREVLVIGRSVTPAEGILEALAVRQGDPILAFDPAAAREALDRIAWVADSVVERRLPDTIVVRLTERRPLAVWQHEQQLRVVDATGAVLAEDELWRFRHLPLIVGSGAPDAAPALLDMLHAEPAVSARVAAAIRVAERRWELELQNGIRVRLPEQGAAEALARLARLEADYRLFERDIVAIDLRMPDRLVIQVSPLANERRRLPEETI
jgi:cell division protein FtsQ